ncbi:glycoside hydrolase family 92 protein [Mucilaginibacter pallidiroseus]|uniref:Glycoside hydrolase family 92 protein n=1 Tax=Mucilaginibacter pallidiroseus TaxID=2599295 RepID=A0A563U0B3_9SPHI|nr:GH92 family glycosyl hydrolase [Mucilaginibacter pallidiroseus]TWR24820.1 glycoside hydrolase family 92 protein [Mucilaginibacter pallidiroseus]
MYKTKLISKIALSFTLIANAATAQQQNLVHYANTLQGTNSKFELSYGNTYPATSVPFAMNTWTPQTGKNGDGWKYQYFENKIRGFQQSHQCSSWVNDYAVFSLMPVTGKLVVMDDDRAASFSHKNEVAQPNYYSVKLDNGIKTEMTTTARGAHLRFSFPTNGTAYLVLDGYTKQSQIKIDVANHKITGWVNNCRWAPNNFKNYFEIILDKPFKTYGTWENKKGEIKAGNNADEGDGKGAYLEFAPGTVVTAKVASSYISPEQANLTLATELGGFKTFDDTKAASTKIWNDLFNRVLVEGGTEAQKATFYSCLYRANLFSHRFFELNKEGKPYYFSPYDGKVHDGYMYTDNGFWDTFRAQFPLNTILHPKMQGQYMQALLAAQEQCGWLPSWSFPSETGGMIGNHAISLLTDAWVKGIRTFDPQRALKAYYHEANEKGPWGGANGRGGAKEYNEKGYVPYSQRALGATAQSLEYAYDDFCGYQLAKSVGNKEYMASFGKNMYNYKTLYDPSTRFMRAKDENGKWVTPFDPLEWGGPYTEGNAWHWQWSVFHDIQGLINLMGGNKNFTAKIDSVFSQPSTIKVGGYGSVIHEMTEMELIKMGQYAHGNQPIQHMIYLYNYAGQPWKSQYYARKVTDKLYNATENGYPGDEDQGQMSSWYVLSAMGIYSVCPGTDQYVIGSPTFKKVTLTLENGKKFVIEAENNSKDNIYIQSASLNGKPYTRNWLSHYSITNGGILKFKMGSKPAYSRGLANADKPFSVSTITR